MTGAFMLQHKKQPRDVSGIKDRLVLKPVVDISPNQAAAVSELQTTAAALLPPFICCWATNWLQCFAC
jgi:hypothetical protein